MIIGVKLSFLFAAGIEPKGCRLTLKITDPEDLNRDVLKVQFYSLETFCLRWLVLFFSRGESIARARIPLHYVRSRYRKRCFAKHVKFSAIFPSSSKTTALTQPRPQGFPVAVPFPSDNLYH